MARKGNLKGSGFARTARSAVKKASLLSLPMLAALVLVFAAPACDGGENQGVLEVRIRDHREAIGDFLRLDLKLDQILISPQPGLLFWRASWIGLPPSLEAIDLTRYVGKSSAMIFAGAVDAGPYDAFHVKIRAVEGVLKKNQRTAQVKNMIGPIKLPFTVEERGRTRIVLDLVVLDMRDHPPLGYELGIKGYELYTNGKLVDKIPPGP